MSPAARVHRHITWLNLSTATLVTLLQRSPVARMVEAADDWVASAPAGAMLKSAVAAAAALGGLDSLAGATVLSSSAASPLNATVGTAITPVVFTLTGTLTIGSWTITGSIPPGLTISQAQNGAPLDAMGNLNGLIPTDGDPFESNNSVTPELSGTPTAAGTYTINFVGYQYGNEAGPASAVFPFTVVVGTASGPTLPPKITTAPLSQSVAAGSPANFIAAASGSPAPTYQWYFNGVAISGAIGTSYGIASPTAANSGVYTVTATNSVGSATSAPATLAVTGTVALPTFTTQPMAAISVVNGSTVALNAQASGTLKYQWSFNGASIPGATNPTFVINGATPAVTGNFALTVTNGAGSVTSNTSTLSITSTSDVGRLVNVSCRAPVSPGANILISGFVVGGDGTSGRKPMLIRATGPTLANYGVPGSLPDPQLQLTTGSGTVLASNTGWANSPAIVAADAAVGATDFPAGSKDSALAATESAGSYTALISGASNDSGVGLVEVFDATPAGSYVATMPRLINLSARAQVGTGGSILIAGFVLGGSSARTVLIRASGPALAALGVPGAMADPELELTTLGGAVLGSNTGWANNPAIANAASSVGTFPWASTSVDSALLVTLPPGPYSVQISGASGDGGLVLAEVYEVP